MFKERMLETPQTKYLLSISHNLANPKQAIVTENR